jgi:oligoendopeptidase F
MNQRTWGIYHQLKKINGELKACYGSVTKIHGLVMQLYDEASREKRKGCFEQASQLDEDLFSKLESFLIQVKEQAKEKGHASALDWVYEEEEDPIDWSDVFSHSEFLRAIQKYSQGLSFTKKKQLKLDSFLPWDYWYQPSSNHQDSFETKNYFKDFKDCLGFVKNFYDQYGLGAETKLIQYMPKKNAPTIAIIDYNDQGWDLKVQISEVGSGTNSGTYKFCSTLVHETAHNINSHLISKPQNDNYLPPYLLSEVISLFFERLFAISDELYSHMNPLVEWPIFQRYIKNEQKDILVRSLSLVDFENSLYSLFERGHFNSNLVSQMFIDQQKKYFGFDDHLDVSHLWQRDIYYLAYSPLKSRSYLYGVVLAEALLDRVRKEWVSLTVNQRNKQLKDCLFQMSSKGVYATWSDYLKLCRMNNPLTVEDLVWGISKVLES